MSKKTQESHNLLKNTVETRQRVDKTTNAAMGRPKSFTKPVAEKKEPSPQIVPSKKKADTLPTHKITYKPNLNPQQKSSQSLQQKSTQNPKPSPIQKIAPPPPATKQHEKMKSYDLLRKAQELAENITLESEYEEVFKKFVLLFKDDIEIFGVMPTEAKTDTGKVVLINGDFYCALAMICMKSTYLIKETYLETLEKKYLPRCLDNEARFREFIEKMKEELEFEKYEKEIRDDEKNKNNNKNEEEEKEHEKVKNENEKMKGQGQRRQSEPITFKREEVQKRIEQIESDSFKKKDIKEVPVYENMNFINSKEKTKQAAKANEQEQHHKEDKKSQSESKSNEPIKRETLSYPYVRVYEPPPSEEKPKGDEINWNEVNCPELPTAHNVIEKYKKQMNEKSHKEKLEQIQRENAYIIDFFEINDIYTNDMVDIIGVLDEIENKYAVITVKEKENVYERQGKPQPQNKEFLCISMMQKLLYPASQDKEILKKIEKEWPNIVGFVDVEDPERTFFTCLPDDSVSEQTTSKKKRN